MGPSGCTASVKPARTAITSATIASSAVGRNRIGRWVKWGQVRHPRAPTAIFSITHARRHGDAQARTLLLGGLGRGAHERRGVGQQRLPGRLAARVEAGAVARLQLLQVLRHRLHQRPQPRPELRLPDKLRRVPTQAGRGLGYEWTYVCMFSRKEDEATSNIPT